MCIDAHASTLTCIYSVVSVFIFDYLISFDNNFDYNIDEMKDMTKKEKTAGYMCLQWSLILSIMAVKLLHYYTGFYFFIFLFSFFKK